MKSQTSVRVATRALLVASFVACASCGGSQNLQGSAASGGQGDDTEPVDAAAPGGEQKPRVDAAVGAADVASAPRDAPAAVMDAASTDAAVRPTDAGAQTGRDGPGAMPNPVAGPAGPWARGVRVSLVEVTQGVFIKVGDSSAVIAPGMRNAAVIEGRPVFARVHVATDAGFVPRKLRAVLSVGYADGSKYEIEDAKMIAGPSNVERLETTFDFRVPAEQVKPNSAIVAAIYESGPATGMDPTVVPRFPSMGGADLGVKAGRMELWIVFVPDGPLLDSPERRKKIEDDVYDLYPVQKVNFRYDPPVPLDGAFTSAKGFAILRDAREKDGAKPYEYYHYLTGATGVGFTGVSRGAGSTIAAAASRVSITIVKGKAIDGNTNTVAHETGHAHGLAHMPGCNAAGPDKNYPYTAVPGDVGGNGYSLTFDAFKSRMMWRELMSYCRPRWVSDYVWNKLEARVRIVTGFADTPAAMAEMMSTRSLQGFAGPGESANWGIVAGRLVDDAAMITPQRYALLGLRDGRQVKMPVAVTLATDDVTKELAVNLTGAGFSDQDVVTAEVFVDGERTMVPTAGMYRRR
jgi:hypothetical protein